MKKSLFFWCCCMAYSAIFAQLPNTDLFLIDLRLNKKGNCSVQGQPQNLTNRNGYDNQPAFLPDGKNILYTATHNEAKTDIYQLHLPDKSTQNLTQTPLTGEYSAQPASGKQAFTVVRVEEDNKTQRLWLFTHNQPPQLHQPYIEPVGYYATTQKNKRLALFVLGSPPTLQVAAATDTAGVIAAVNIGRCILPAPGKPNSVLFLHKISNQNWLIKRLNTETLDTKTIAKALPDAEDFAALPNEGGLLMASGSKLYCFNPQTNQWKVMADFSAIGIKNITRLALSPDAQKLVFVAEINP